MKRAGLAALALLFAAPLVWWLTRSTPSGDEPDPLATATPARAEPANSPAPPAESAATRPGTGEGGAAASRRATVAAATLPGFAEAHAADPAQPQAETTTRPASLTVHGRVVTRDGAPVAGADVILGPRREPGDSIKNLETFGAPALPGAVPTETLGKSDARGAFALSVADTRATLRLEASRHLFRGDAIDLEPQAARAAGAVELVLVPVAEVTGRVVGDGSVLVANARVSVVVAQGTSPRATEPVSTDAQGRFAATVDTPGAVTLQVGAAGFQTVTAPGPIAVLGESADAGDVMLPRGETVRGVVLAADGRPEPGRRVEARPADGGSRALPASAVTATDGTFELAGLTRDAWALTCVGPSRQQMSLATARPLVVRPPADRVEIRLDEHVLHVLVIDRDSGAPIPRCEVRFSRGHGAGADSHGTHDDGEGFVIGLEAGVAWQMVALAPGYRDSAEQTVALARDEARRDLTIRLERESSRAFVDLRVTDEQDQPIPWVRVAVFRLAGGAPVFVRHEDLRSQDGMHRVGPFEPGRIQLEVHALRGEAERDAFFKQRLVVDVGRGRNEQRDVRLRRGGLVVLQVREPGGSHLGGVAARLARADGNAVPVSWCVMTLHSTSCETGRVPQPGPAIPDDALPPGAYRVDLSCAGFAPRSVDFTIVAGRSTPVEVTLERAR